MNKTIANLGKINRYAKNTEVNIEKVKFNFFLD